MLAMATTLLFLYTSIPVALQFYRISSPLRVNIFLSSTFPLPFESQQEPSNLVYIMRIQQQHYDTSLAKTVVYLIVVKGLS